MRRKLLMVSCAMIFGIWCAGINVILAVSISLAAFLLGKSANELSQITHVRNATEYVQEQSEKDEKGRVSSEGEGDNGRSMSDRKRMAAVLAAAVLFGALRMELQTVYYDSAEDLCGSRESSTYTAEVLGVSRKKDSLPKLTVRIENRKCLLSWKGGKEKEDIWKLTGALIEFKGSMELPDGARNPRCFDNRAYLRSKGISLLSSTDTIRIIRKNAGPGGALKRYILAFREGFIKAICGNTGRTGTVSEEAASGNKEKGSYDSGDPGAGDISMTEALIRGVLFGDTDNMSEDMKEDFRSNGTAHILAVSALHIGLLYSVFRTLRKKLHVPGMTPLFILILLIYGTMTLWTVSVTRAAMLIILMEAGDRLDRRFDMLTSLGFVSMLVLIRDPYALYGTSFIMSYLAAVSIGVICPVIKHHLPDRVPGSIKTSLAVQAGLIPYIAYTFNTVSLGALIINIPVVFLLTWTVTISAAAVPVFALTQTARVRVIHELLLPAGGDTGVTRSVSDIIMAPFRLMIDLLSGATIFINERFSEIDLLSPDVVSPPLILIIAVYAALFTACSESFTIARLRKDYRIIGPHVASAVLIMLIAGLWSFMAYRDFDQADIVMVDVGQGDCVQLSYRPETLGEVITEGGSASPTDDLMGRMKIWLRRKINGRVDVMIDGGGSDRYKVGKNTLKPYLLSNGVRRLDAAFATHLHTDHYKGLEELAEEHMVKKLITEGKTGDVYYIGEPERASGRDDMADRIEIIWPDERDPDTDDENKNSLIFKVYVNGTTMLITGDMGEEGEHALLERYRGTGVLDCDVLKVGHHGSRYGSSSEFIEEVSPEVALIGVGKNNTYGHPSEDVIKRLKEAGAAVYRTDLDGAIGLRRVGDELIVCTMS